ncbi:MAG: hypothetical protein IJ811_00420 [Clostridia bacterium]|nr:hypothetical protein [Clostridia bacterium]
MRKHRKGILLVVLICVLIIVGIIVQTNIDRHQHNELYEYFSQRENCNEICVVWERTYLYFPDHKLKIKSLGYDGTICGALCSYNGKLYFATSKKVKGEYSTLRIYCCDYYGNDLNEVYSNSDFYAISEVQWYDQTSNLIYFVCQEVVQVIYKTTVRKDVVYAYDLANGEFYHITDDKFSSYKKELIGENSDLDRLKEYSDKRILSDSDEGKTVSRNNGYRLRFFSLNGKIYVSYSIIISSSDFVHVIFEYEEETDKFVFSSAHFVIDTESMNYFYLY